MAHAAWPTVLNGVGPQTIIDESARMYAVAVRNGDVDATVPEPGTAALVLLALAAGAAVRRRPREPLR